MRRERDATQFTPQALDTVDAAVYRAMHLPFRSF
jgi:hypothetical protein